MAEEKQYVVIEEGLLQALISNGNNTPDEVNKFISVATFPAQELWDAALIEGLARMKHTGKGRPTKSLSDFLTTKSL